MINRFDVITASAFQLACSIFGLTNGGPPIELAVVSAESYNFALDTLQPTAVIEYVCDSSETITLNIWSSDSLTTWVLRVPSGATYDRLSIGGIGGTVVHAVSGPSIDGACIVPDKPPPNCTGDIITLPSQGAGQYLVAVAAQVPTPAGGVIGAAVLRCNDAIG